MTLQNYFFLFAFSSWGTHLLSFFTFPVCFKCQTIIEWSTLSSWPTSCLVVRRLALMILSVGHCQLPIAWPACFSSSRLSSLAKLHKPPLHHTFVSSSWARCIVDVVNCLHCFVTDFEIKKKNCLNLLFV